MTIYPPSNSRVHKSSVAYQSALEVMAKFSFFPPSARCISKGWHMRCRAGHVVQYRLHKFPALDATLSDPAEVSLPRSAFVESAIPSPPLPRYPYFHRQRLSHLFWHPFHAPLLSSYFLVLFKGPFRLFRGLSCI